MQPLTSYDVAYLFLDIAQAVSLTIVYTLEVL